MDEHVGKYVRVLFRHDEEAVEGYYRERRTDNPFSVVIVSDNSVTYIPDEHIKEIIPIKPKLSVVK